MGQAIKDTAARVPDHGVLLFSDSDVYAGTEAHIFTLALGLTRLGIDCAVACPAPSPLSEKTSAAGIEVVPIAKQGRFLDRGAINTLIALLRAGRFKIVHTHNGRTHLNTALAIGRARSGRCVATQHFIDPGHSSRSGIKARLFGCAHRWVNERTARFIAISIAVERAMLERGDAPPQKIAVVPNGIDEPNIIGLKTSEEIRAELSIASDAPLVVCIARLEKEKDVRSLIAAFREAAAAVPTAACAIAGEGAQRGELERQVRELGLEDSVSLLGFREDAHSLIRAADVFVLPSLSEPFGLVLLEAMALERPVIATRAGGPLEIVADGETGLLVEPSNAEALAAAIIGLLQCPEEAARMGRAGRMRYAKRYTARQMAEATRSVYDDACERRG